MQTVGIMTWLHNGNYGTVLQAYALQRYLRNNGFPVTNIDFNASTTEKVRNLVRRGNSPKLFVEKFDIALTKKEADAAKLSIKEDRFRKFLENNFNLTPRISTYEGLIQYAAAFDVYISGSDQIWSPALLNTPYYLDFVSRERKKIAYACSFGVSNVPRKKAALISELLKRYEHISVREQAGQKIVEDIIGKNVPINVDPVFLLDCIEWDKVSSGKCVDGEYVFAYFLTYNKSYIEFAQKVAKNLGIKLVMVPATKEEYRVDAELIQDAGPSEWVSLIRNANAVLTDSFHGCVFSLIYERPLMIFKRFADDNKDSQNSRIYTLIHQYGLQDALIDANECCIEKLEFSAKDVQRQIIENSTVSKEWLLNSIGG